jgi:hypothetical protein
LINLAAPQQLKQALLHSVCANFPKQNNIND